MGRGGRGGERDGGRVMVGFGGETAEPSALFAGRGEGGSGVEFSDGAARCPSRRSIIEVREVECSKLPPEPARIDNLYLFYILVYKKRTEILT